MNTPNQHPELNGIIQPSGDPSSKQGKTSAWLTSSLRLISAGFLAGLALLFFAAPAARADRSPAGCLGSGLGISLFTSLPDVHIGDTIYYSVYIFNTPFPACDAGATNPASIGAIRAFVVTPDGVTNAITLRRTYLPPGASDYYTNVVSYVVRAQDIRPDGTVRATASDEGDIHQNDTNSRGGGDQGVNTEVNLPCIGISALCVGTTGENGAIIFTGTVTNCGNTTLVGVTVTNFHDGGFFTVLFPTNLAIRQSATFSGSWVPFNPCLPSTATLTARASDEFTATPRVVVSSTNITCQNTLTPGIKVTKVCPPQPVSPGQLLTFSGSVSNTGNVTLTNIVVVNNQPVANTVVFVRSSLAPGVAVSFTGSYLAPTNCSVADTLSATATSRCGGNVSDIASATCPILTTPQIAIVAACPTAPILPGGTLTYSGTVRNTGNISLTNVVVVSDRPVANTVVLTVATMAPGASTNFTATYNVPANACTVTTIFSGTGKDICTTATVTNSASATCTVITAPRIAVTLVCPVAPATAGGLITYTGMVTNTGNVILNNVTVVNNQASPSTVLTVPSLAPGAFANFFASFTAPVDACSVSSTVKATGSDDCTRVMVTNTASATCALITTPGIKVTKVCPRQPVAPGQLFTFSGSVSNTGNVTLTNVVIINNQPVANTVVMTVASLAPGTITNFTGSYLAPTNCSVDDTLIASGRSICGAAVTNMVSATCPIATTPRLAVTQNCPVIPAIPGGLLTYSGTVSNAGNITVTNVIVLNNLSGATPIFTIASLAPGVVASFTGSYLAPTNCSTTSTSTATGWSVCGVAVTNTASATCSITTTPRIVVTESCPVTPAIPGGLLTYSGTVSNAGNITLTNVVVMNNLSGAAPVFTTATLAPGALASFTGSYRAPTNCSSTSTLTGTGRSICGVAVTNTVSATCPINTTPRLVVTQNCPVTPAIPGGLLTYSGTVSNAGNITVTNVVVLNNLSGVTPVFTTATLAPGAVASFTGSYRTPTNCSSTSTSTATGRSICGVAVTNTASATCTILTAPQIAVTALCPTAPVLPGGTLTYSGTVRNSGNISLTNVVVVSDRPAANTIVMTVDVMAPGASTNFTATYNVPANACMVATIFSGTARDICTTATVTNRASATCAVITAPSIAVTLACPVAPATAGGLITYTGMVTNTGNVTLNNVTVVNNQASPSTVLTVPSLAPGAFANFFASFTAPVDACSVSSTVKATGSDDCTRVMVTNTASATCALITTPGIKVTKVCPKQPVSIGQLLTFSGSVSNTGNVTLTNVIVINNQPVANTVVLTVASLAPGTITNFTGSYLAPTNCFVSDTLIASGRSICGAAVTNMVSATCPIRTSPAIVVTQTCPTTPVVQGGILTYSGTVSNAGNITLTNIVVVNNWPAPNTVVFTTASLAPGAMTNFTGSYQVPANCCVAWSTVVARGQDCYGVTVTDTDSGTCTVLTMPAIMVTKVCAPGIVRPGDLLTYVGVVINTGNIALMNVTVVNNQPGGGSLLLGPITLAPGESATYAASYIVPPDFCGGDTVTARGLDACSYAPVVSRVTVTCPVAPYSPRIAVTKHCPPQPTPHGGTLVFSGTVSNLGDVTLVNVFVVNNQPSNNTPVIGPITLAPGGFLNFTGSYVVPPLCCSMIDTLTARAMDRCTGSNVSATATAVCPLLYTPSIAVVQACPPGPIPMGSLYVFSGFVTNTGDAILTNVLVFSSQAGQNQRLLGPIDLAPGQAEPYAGSLTVASNICAVTITATSQEVCAGTRIISSTPCPVATTPRLVVTQNCPPSPVRPGSLVTFSGTVSNAGNITLTNVVARNNLSGASPVFAMATLAPGTATNYTGSYLAPTNGSVRTTNTVIATGVDICQARTVSNTADCLVYGGPGSFRILGAPSASGGLFRVSFPTEKGKSYTGQYKNALNDPIWTDLETVAGTGGPLSITNTGTSQHPTRFYRIRSQ